MLEINPGLIIWTIITFILLLVLLRTFAWKPLLSALEKREQHIRSSIEHAENATQEAEQLAAQNRKFMSDAEVKSQKLLKDSRELGEKLKSEIIAKANQQSKHIIEQAKLEIEREKEAALLKLRSEIADLSILVASKILGETLDSDKHRRVIDSYLEELQKN